LRVFGVLFGIAGVATVFADPVSGILLILMAAIVLPPATRLMTEKFNFSLSGGVKAILIIVLLGVAASTMDVSDSATSVVSDSTTVASENATTSEVTQPQEKVSPIEIVSIDTRVTESNQVWWKYA